MQSSKGFTLIEVMVAIAIMAVIAVTVYTANAQALTAASEIKLQSEARMVNMNQLTFLRISKALPEVGTKNEKVEFNNRTWIVEMDVQKVDYTELGVPEELKSFTDFIDPYFRKIELRARPEDDEQIVDVLTAYLGNA